MTIHHSCRSFGTANLFNMSLLRAVRLGALLVAQFLLAQESNDHTANSVRRYRVIDLGTPRGSTFSQASTISDTGVISGLAALTPKNPQRAVVWENGRIRELRGFGGVNSGAFGAVKRGQLVAVGQAESADIDPNHENFCGYGGVERCVPVLWNGHHARQLPTLGGNNGTAGPINARGEIAGTAETEVTDLDCSGTVAPNGTGPQVLGYKGVVWGPEFGLRRTLEPLSEKGDRVSTALWMNDRGEAVGASGTCANTEPPPLAYGPHAVLWDRDGVPYDLGNLGSTVANAALSINNHGVVVGASSPTDQSTNSNGVLAFLWTREQGMRSLGTLPDDVASGATGINDRGVIIGVSIDPMGNPRAVVWQHGSIASLNDLAIGDSPFETLLFAFGINYAGEIVGFGVTDAGDVHGFLATPCDDAIDSEPFPRHTRRQAIIPEYVRDMIRERLESHRR